MKRSKRWCGCRKSMISRCRRTLQSNWQNRRANLKLFSYCKAPRYRSHYLLVQYTQMHKGTSAAKLLEAMLLKLSASKIGLPSVVTPSSKAKTASTQKQAPGAEAEVAEDPMSKISLLVGHILSCGAHPDADSLLVEQIDVGEEAPRTICSGLAKHYTEYIL